MTPAFQKQPLAAGAYTLPDAARIIEQPLARLRRWVAGVSAADSPDLRRHPAGKFASRDAGRDKHVDFYTLIELFVVAELRKAGLSMKTLRQSREELIQRFKTPYPFALKELLLDGKRLLKELGDDALLELGTKGQTAFEKIVAPFCKRVDFDESTNLASCYYPKGKKVPIVVSPFHAFGRPVLKGTNIPTETIACRLRGGETPEDIAVEYQLKVEEIVCVQKFEKPSSTIQAAPTAATGHQRTHRHPRIRFFETTKKKEYIRKTNPKKLETLIRQRGLGSLTENTWELAASAACPRQPNTPYPRTPEKGLRTPAPAKNPAAAPNHRRNTLPNASPTSPNSPSNQTTKHDKHDCQQNQQ